MATIRTFESWQSQSVESFSARWQAEALPRTRGDIAWRVLAAHPLLDCYQPGDVAPAIVEAARLSGVTDATVGMVPAGVPLAAAIDLMCDRLYHTHGISL